MSLSRPAWILVLIALVTLSVRAGSSVHRLAESFVAPGPNTIGEAGKVYFAARMQVGEQAFSDGMSPPFYPSVHGVATHALVAAAGRAAGLATEQLYTVGRTISLVLTLAAAALLIGLGRRMSLSPITLVVGGLVWIGSYTLIKHAVSYRPDNWLLFLSLLAAWTVSRGSLSRKHLALLAVLPTIAFHVKSPGIVLAGIICFCVLMRRGPRTTGWLAAGQTSVLAVSVFAIQQLTGGSYLNGLTGARAVSFSWEQAFTVVIGTGDLFVPFLLAAPVLFLSIWLRSSFTTRPVTRTVLVFWLGTVGACGFAAMRVGSDTYYFLEPATYGLLLGLAGYSEWTRRGAVAGKATNRLGRPIAIAAFVLTVLSLPSLLPLAGDGYPLDTAHYRTRHVASVRSELAERINREGLYCYSDDPGLNVLLERPAVIYPVLETQMIRSGSLPTGTRIDRLQDRAFGCVVLCGIRWKYRGVPTVGDAFYEAAREYYPRIERVGPYELRFPPADTLPKDAATRSDAP